jgi:hypothetical protein
MVLDGLLAAAGDKQDVADPGGHRFLHDVLMVGVNDDRQHLLAPPWWRQKPRSHARGG